MNSDVQSQVEGIGGWSSLLAPLTEGQNLSVTQTRAAMDDILTGRASDAQLAAFMIALRIKGETSDELVGLAEGMLAAAQPLNLPADTVDIVGTGGSRHRQRHALNISTMASFIVAACGVTVCKHGNRKATSTSGSFDFLEAAGIEIGISPSQLERCVENTGLGFAFARTFHPAMRFVAPARAELGVPTVFNILGPLAHPGRPSLQVVGTASIELAQTMTEALQKLGVKRAWIVTGDAGYDELTLSGPTHVFELTPSNIVEFTVSANEAGLGTVESMDELAGGTGAENATIFNNIVCGNETGPKRDIVLLNAAAALVVAGRSANLLDGVDLARAAIEDGAAAAQLHKLRTLTLN